MPPAIRDKYQYFTQSDVENLRRAGYTAAFTPLEEAVGRYVTLFLDRAGPLPLTDRGSAPAMHNIDQQLARLNQATVLCIGDLMLDDFVYGEVTRISPEAPAPVLAVTRSEMVDRRRRQRGAQHRVARRPLLFRRRGRRGRFRLELDAGARCRAADRAASRGRRDAPDDAQGPLRLRALFDPPAARRLGTGQDRSVADIEKAVIDRALALLPDVASVVLSDYAKGVLTPRVIRAVIDAARSSASPSSSIPRARTSHLSRRDADHAQPP